MSQKHMSKKELNEDPFFEEVAHIIEFFKKHQVALVSILVVLVVGVGGFFGAKSIINQQSMKASGNFGIAMDYYNKDMLVEAEDQFMLVAEQYKRNDWGKRANYYLALVSQKLQKPEEESLEYLEAFVRSDLEDKALKASAYQLIGTYYYRNGDLISAADNYFLAAKKAIGNSNKLELALRAGDVYADAGESKEIDAIVKYLGTLELNEADKLRVKALARR